MVSISKEDINEIIEGVSEAILPPIAKSFDKLEKRIFKVEKGLDGVEDKLGEVEKRLDNNNDKAKSLTEEIQDFRQQNHLEHKALERRLDAEVGWKDQAEKRLVKLENKS